MDNKKIKIILSRKGFDGTAGGIDSPIFENGDMISFPIPEENGVKYEDLYFTDKEGNNVSYYKLLKDLGYDFNEDKKNYSTCHLDPDLLQHKQKNSVIKSDAKFGQADSAEGYLRSRVEVNTDDIFIFFGRFKKIRKNTNGNYEYCNKNGNSMNVIWGYLQVGEIIDEKKIKNVIHKYGWHPHVKNEKYAQSNKKNTIYVARKELYLGDDVKLDGKYKGYGIFKFDDNNTCLKLTKDGESMSTWKYKEFYDDENIYKVKRKNSKKGQDVVQYLGQWQEIGLLNDNEDLYKEQIEWLKEIIESNKENKIE